MKAYILRGDGTCSVQAVRIIRGENHFFKHFTVYYTRPFGQGVRIIHLIETYYTIRQSSLYPVPTLLLLKCPIGMIPYKMSRTQPILEGKCRPAMSIYLPQIQQGSDLLGSAGPQYAQQRHSFQIKKNIYYESQPAGQSPN